MKQIWMVALIFSLGQEEKVELRYGFKKGETFPLRLRYALNVKLEQLPEGLQGILSEEPIDIKFEGVVEVEVTDVAGNGTASLSGNWRTAKASGHVMVNDLDFAFDSSKEKGDKAKKKEEMDDPGFMDMQDQLNKMVRLPLKFSVDPLGKVTLAEGSGRLGALEGPFRSLNGLMGPLPRNKIGKGDTWKEKIHLEMPGVAGNIDLVVTTNNSYDSAEKVDGRDVVTIKSTFTVSAGEPVSDLNITLKIEGEGEGRMTFLLQEGRPAKSQSLLKARVNAVLPNPGGDGEMEIKAVVKIETGHDLGK
jgi:hypothetical protein